MQQERIKNNKEEQKESKRGAIVVSRFSALGDVALAVPPVYDFAAANPHKDIVVVTRPWMAKMFITDHTPANIKIHPVDLATTYRGIKGMMKLTAELCRKYNVEHYIDLHDVLRTRAMRIFFKLRGVKVTKIDKGRSDKKKLVKAGAMAYGKQLASTLDRYYSAFARAGYPLERKFVSLYPGAHAADGIKRIGIAPFAAHQGKIYPLESMKEIVDYLAAQEKTLIYLFGAGEKEKEILSSWAQGHPRIHDMATAASGLTAELKLMATLDVMLAMDSGNMHLASIAGTGRVVSVWGATHPAAGFAPFRGDPACMVGVDMDCRPCSVYGNKPCRYGDYRCMTKISKDRIIKLLDV